MDVICVPDVGFLVTEPDCEGSQLVSDVLHLTRSTALEELHAHARRDPGGDYEIVRGDAWYVRCDCGRKLPTPYLDWYAAQEAVQSPRCWCG